MARRSTAYYRDCAVCGHSHGTDMCFERGCRCTIPTSAKNLTKFEIEHQKYLALLDTPTEQAKLAREAERVAACAANYEPLGEFLTRLLMGVPRAEYRALNRQTAA